VSFVNGRETLEGWPMRAISISRARLIVALAVTLATVAAMAGAFVGPSQQGVFAWLPFSSLTRSLLPWCVPPVALLCIRFAWRPARRLSVFAFVPVWGALALWYSFDVDIYLSESRVLQMLGLARSWLPALLWMSLSLAVFIAALSGTFLRVGVRPDSDRPR
jgi:hypothetical protein